MTARLPDGIAELLATRVDSFEKLELVVALHGAPHMTMSIEGLCRVLKLSRDNVRRAVLELRSVALVELAPQGEVKLQPPTTRELEVVGSLVRLYDEDRLEVVKALGEIAVERIRGMAFRAFADAFVFRKKPLRDGDDG